MSKPPTAPSSERLSKGSVLLGRYEIEELLGSGGMAAVYRARDQFLNRDVAIKVMAPWLADDEAYSRRFSEEARAAAGLNHPNIVTIYDTAEEDGRRYIVMELVDGRPLNELMPLERQQAVDIARQLALALDYAHSKGIIHCDIKPQNVLVEPSGRPRLLDFGIARATTQTWAMATTVLGTAAYMAPEVVEGHRPDARSDVYSLATLLYEMLAGRLPFEGDSAAAQTAQRLVSPPRPLSDAAAVPGEVEKAIMAGLERDLDKRPQTASAFAESLGKAANNSVDASLTAPVAVPFQVDTETEAGVVTPSAEPASGEPLTDAFGEPIGPTDSSAQPERRSSRWLVWPLGAVLVAAIFAAAFFAGGALFADDDEPDYEAYFAQLQATFDTFESQHELEAQEFGGQQGDDSEANKQLYVDFLRAYVDTRTEFVGALDQIEVPEDLQDEHQAYMEAATAVVFALADFADQVETTEPALVRTLDISTFEQAEENQVRACNTLQAAATERGYELNLRCAEVEGAVQAPSFGSTAPVEPAAPVATGREAEGGDDDDDDDGGGGENGGGEGNDKGRGNDKGKGRD